MSQESDLPKKILIVDKDPNVATKIVDSFEKIGVQITIAQDFHTAKYRFDKEFYRVVLIAAKFEEHDALDLIQKWRGHEVVEKRHAGFIIMSQYQVSKEKMTLMEELSGVKILPKPLSFGDTLNVVKQCFAYGKDKVKKEKVHKQIVDQFEEGKLDIEGAIALTYTSKDHLKDAFYPLVVDLHRVDESLVEAKNILKNAPRNAMEPLKMFNLKGEVHLMLGEHDEAKACFLKADQLAPRNVERISKLVDTFLELKQPDLAVARQKEILDMNKDDDDMKFDMFKKLEDYGYSEHAIEFCKEISNPLEVVKYFNNKGVSLSKTGNSMEAIKEYKRALQYFSKSKKNYILYYNIALSLLKTKNKKNLKPALESVEKSLKLKSDFEKAWDLKERIEAIAKNAGVLQTP
jgi:tetratricopeptide (TPR) repeat protein